MHYIPPVGRAIYPKIASLALLSGSECGLVNHLCKQRQSIHCPPADRDKHNVLAPVNQEKKKQVMPKCINIPGSCSFCHCLRLQCRQPPARGCHMCCEGKVLASLMSSTL